MKSSLINMWDNYVRKSKKPIKYKYNLHFKLFLFLMRIKKIYRN